MKRIVLVVLAVLSGVAVAHAQSPTHSLPLTHTVTLTAVAVDAANFQAVAPCEAVTWTTSDANKATVAPMANTPLVATLTPVAPGVVTITATCGPLTQTVEVQIVGAPVALWIGMGVPKPKGT